MKRAKSGLERGRGLTKTRQLFLAVVVVVVLVVFLGVEIKEEITSNKTW